MDKQNQRFNNKIGEEYDLFQIASPFHNTIQEEIGTILKDHFKSTSKNISGIELGFGTGITSKVILDSLPNIHLLAVDNVSHMLEKAHSYLNGINNDRFTLIINDALVFLQQIPDNSIDFVATAWVLHNIDTDIRFNIYREIYRVLKSGGIFINADKIADANRVTHTKDFEWQLKQFDIFETHNRPDLKDEWTRHYHADEEDVCILKEDIYKIDLINIGFKNYIETKRYYMDRVIYVTKE